MKPRTQRVAYALAVAFWLGVGALGVALWTLWSMDGGRVL